MIKVYRYRVKDKHKAELNRLAKRVNFVWNFCNDTQKHALRWGKKWPTNYDLQKLSAGSSVELGLNSNTIAKVCEQYVHSRRQHNRPYLRYRGRKSLGWVPVMGRTVRHTEKGFRIFLKDWDVWLSRKAPPDARVCEGTSFSQDAKGNWFINVAFEVKSASINEKSLSVGIDLGLKEFAVMSDGNKVEAQRHFRAAQDSIGKAQRANKKRLVIARRMKVANQRKDFLHKLSHRITRQYGFIAVGDVSSSRLAKTRMAKSVLDAGWGSFRHMLAYKSVANGVSYVEVNERFTTQICSDCGVVSGPKGRENLGVREWECPCGALHDRDVNSAKNILRLGYQTLTGATQ